MWGDAASFLSPITTLVDVAVAKQLPQREGEGHGKGQLWVTQGGEARGRKTVETGGLGSTRFLSQGWATCFPRCFLQISGLPAAPSCSPPSPTPPIRPSLWGPSAPPLRLGQWPWEEPEHPGVILLGKEGPPRPGKKAAADCRQRWTHARWGQWSPRRQRFFLEGWWLGRERARFPSGVRAGPGEVGLALG